MNSARWPYRRFQPRRTRLAQLGFTLVELMLVIVIVGLLTAIALPNFTGQTKKAKVTEAISLSSAALKQAAAEFAEDASAGITKWQDSCPLPKKTRFLEYKCLGFEPTMPRVTVKGLAESGLNNDENTLLAEVDLDPQNKLTGRLGKINICGTMPGLSSCSPGG